MQPEGLEILEGLVAAATVRSLAFCQIYLLTGSLQCFDLSSCHQD